MKLPVGLCNAEIQFALANSVEVIDRTARGFRRAANPVLFSSLVNQATNRPAGRIIHAGNTARADADELIALR